MDIARIVLEYFQALTSPQMVIGAVLVTFLVLFRENLQALITRIAFIRWGQAEVAVPQLPTETGKDEKKGRIDEQRPRTNDDPFLPAGLNVSPEDAKRLEEAMLAERWRAHYWEYRYLNHFLVLTTQRVLDWLVGLPKSVTFTTFDALWQPFIPTAEQRRTIIQVLEEHNLIAMHGDLIEVTPKGREYVEWRGPIPSPSPPTTGTPGG